MRVQDIDGPRDVEARILSTVCREFGSKWTSKAPRRPRHARIVRPEQYTFEAELPGLSPTNTYMGTGVGLDRDWDAVKHRTAPGSPTVPVYASSGPMHFQAQSAGGDPRAAGKLRGFEQPALTD